MRYEGLTRTVEGMISEEEFHDAFSGFVNEGGVGGDCLSGPLHDERVSRVLERMRRGRDGHGGHGAGGLRLGGTGGDLDQTHSGWKWS